MTDPQPAKLKKTPPRAEPLQPDLPGRATGDAKSPQDVDIEDPAVASGRASQRDDPSVAKESQEENALKNVSEGYK